MKKLIFMSLLFLSACVPPHGTGTGNPFNNGASSPASTLASGKVFFTVCKMLELCNPSINDESCFNGLQNLDGFGPKFGLNMNPPPTVAQILTLESDLQIVPDESSTNHCRAQMLKLECTDAVMQNAYIPGAPSPFEHSPEMLDPMCAGIFGP